MATLVLAGMAGPLWGQGDAQKSFPCQPLQCSTLLPSLPVDDPHTNDCAYRAGNLWWVDYVAGSLEWVPAAGPPATRHSAPSPSAAGQTAPGQTALGQPTTRPRHEPVIVAVFDDGADIDHEDLRNQLWTNEAELHGKAGVDDDGNGYVDDVHGWNFVDDTPDVSPPEQCRGQVSHGTMMASLIAAERNNGVGIAAPGSDAARLMLIKVVGCGPHTRDPLDPHRMARALEYATKMGARILSFSSHWHATTPELDQAFAEVADRPGPHAAVVVASVPNRGEPTVGYPAAYTFRRIIRAIPIGNDDMISPGTSPAPIGLNLGAPSACVIGAAAPPEHYRVEQGSSNSTAILSGVLAGIWASPAYAKLTPDEFVAGVVRKRMSTTPRRSKPGSRAPYDHGVPLADACVLATQQRSARVCRSQEPRTGKRANELQRNTTGRGGRQEP